MRSSANLTFLALLIAAGGGARAIGATPQALPSYGSYQDSGLSSWYGEELTGNRTASGERFDPAGMTAAHRTLPLGSFVEVTSVETGRSIVVRINDRGPGRRDRLIDLSRAAAQLLGIDRSAIAHVRVRAILPSDADAATLRAGRSIAARMPVFTQAMSRNALPRPALVPAFVAGRSYGLQIATFSNEDRARALAGVLDAHIVAGGGFWRVRLGPFKTQRDLQRARDAVATRGYGDAQILSGADILPED